jgi:CBS domain-containing protein
MQHDMVGSVMTMDVVRAMYATPFKKVAQLLADHRIGGLPVVNEDDRVIGVISASDLAARQAATADAYPPRRRFRVPALTPAARRRTAKAAARTAGQLMSAPPITVHADDAVVEAARTMARQHVERLPVLDEEDRLVGIVTRGDLLQVLRSEADIRGEVIDEVLARALRLAPRSIDVTVTEGVVTLVGQLERKSEAETAVAMTRQVDGVVAVVDQLGWRLDDTRLRSDEAALHGVADGRPREL